MGMTATAIRFYTDSERIAYQKIDGMDEETAAMLKQIIASLFELVRGRTMEEVQERAVENRIKLEEKAEESIQKLGEKAEESIQKIEEKAQEGMKILEAQRIRRRERKGKKRRTKRR